jgi:hypothetical protein
MLITQHSLLPHKYQEGINLDVTLAISRQYLKAWVTGIMTAHLTTLEQN